MDERCLQHEPEFGEPLGRWPGPGVLADGFRDLPDGTFRHRIPGMAREEVRVDMRMEVAEDVDVHFPGLERQGDGRGDEGHLPQKPLALFGGKKVDLGRVRLGDEEAVAVEELVVADHDDAGLQLRDGVRSLAREDLGKARAGFAGGCGFGCGGHGFFLRRYWEKIKDFPKKKPDARSGSIPICGWVGG
jgi:hypothetical protein